MQAVLIPFGKALMTVAGSKLAMTGLAVAGTGVSALGEYRRGQAQEMMGDAIAKQSIAAGKAEQAASQREAIEKRRIANIKKSRALAVAGASGTSVIDPDVINVLAGFDYEGDYEAKVALYSGNEAMRQRKNEASVARWEGDLQKTNSLYRSGATILSGTGDILRNKYAVGDRPGNYGGGKDIKYMDKWHRTDMRH
jgi:hypothetical protein